MLAGEIARCLAELVMLDAPTLSVLLGRGTGGGALALVPADRVVAARRGAARLAVAAAARGASVIVHRDVEHASQMADEQGVRSNDLAARGSSTASSPSIRTRPMSRWPSASGSDAPSSTSWSPWWRCPPKAGRRRGTTVTAS